MIKPLKSEWCPNAFVITFKVRLNCALNNFILTRIYVQLETIPAILQGKCLKHFSDYGVQMVIGNILGQHKHTVHVYEPDNNTPTTISVPEDQHRMRDVEQLLVPVIVQAHNKYVNN